LIPILGLKVAFRPKYLLIDKLRGDITLSGRRWEPHGSSKEGSGKEAGSKEGSKEGSTEEEVMPLLQNNLNTFYRNFSKIPVNFSSWTFRYDSSSSFHFPDLSAVKPFRIRRD
jgi:hypothetical protein